MKNLLITSLLLSTMLFGSNVLSHDCEKHESTTSAENAATSEAATPASDTNENKGSCEQNCYNMRNVCFNSGGNAELCDPIYDACKAGCG